MKLVALDKIAFFRDLGYQPHPGQLEVHRSRAPRRVVALMNHHEETLEELRMDNKMIKMKGRLQRTR
jgi:hypothetical protein